MPIQLQMPLRIELVCMKSEGNLDVNAIEGPGHEYFTFPLQSHNLFVATHHPTRCRCTLQP